MGHLDSRYHNKHLDLLYSEEILYLIYFSLYSYKMADIGFNFTCVM